MDLIIPKSFHTAKEPIKEKDNPQNGRKHLQTKQIIKINLQNNTNTNKRMQAN